MIIDLSFPEEVLDIIRNSTYYKEPLRLTEEQILCICEFSHFFRKEKHLRFFQNEGNILYGFCYSHTNHADYWMFLDNDYVFYDVKLPHNRELSNKTRSEINNILSVIQKCCFI